jgi:hypothetical protein
MQLNIFAPEQNIPPRAMARQQQQERKNSPAQLKKPKSNEIHDSNVCFVFALFARGGKPTKVFEVIVTIETGFFLFLCFHQPTERMQRDSTRLLSAFDHSRGPAETLSKTSLTVYGREDCCDADLRTLLVSLFALSRNENRNSH